MKTRIALGIPGRKAKESAAGTKPPQDAPEKAGTEDSAPQAPPPESREPIGDRNRKSEARRELEARVRGKLKKLRKR